MGGSRSTMSRFIEALLVSAIVVAGIHAGALVHSWYASLGVLALAAAGVLVWGSVISSAVRFVRRGIAPLTPTLELWSEAPRHRFIALLFFAPFAVVPQLIYVLNPERSRPPAGFLVLPFAMAAISMLMATWSYGVDIDGRTRRVVRWTGPRIGPRGYRWLERQYDIPTTAHVELDEEHRDVGKNGDLYVHTVRVDKPAELLHECFDADIARLRAEHVAKELGLDLVDRSAADDEARRRAVAQLDMPLSEQLRLRGELSARRELPARTTLVLESADLPWVVRMRPRGLRGGDIFGLVASAPFIYVGSLLPAVIISVVLDQSPRFALGLGFVIAAAVAWYALWRPVFRSRRETQLIELSSSGIRVARRSLGLVSSGQLSAERIEEIVITYNRGARAEGLCVVARGDGVSLSFGHGLEREDAIYLRDTAIAALAPRSIYR